MIDVAAHTVDELVKALHDKVKQTCMHEATRWELVLTCEGAFRSVQTTGADYLRASGISMKNLRGEWIK